jgi:predicted small secreted protein
MIRKIVLAAMLTGAVTLSACNTLRGAKEDVHSAGSAVGNATDGNKGT